MVRSEIGNPDGALKSEMFASFKIATEAGAPTPAVPTVAVIREGDVATVWVETEPMLFKRRVVEIGIAAGRPDADSQRSRCSANWSSRAARFSSTTSGVNDRLAGAVRCCVV